MSKIGVGGVKLAMTEKGAGVAGCAMRRGVKWRDGLWTGWGEKRGTNSCRDVTHGGDGVSNTQWSKHDPVFKRERTPKE